MHALSGITIIFIPDKEPKYRTVQLNTGYLATSKTEFILIGLHDQLKKIPDPTIFLSPDSASTHTFTPTSPVRNLGVIFDQNLSFLDHITQLSRSCFMHIRDLRRIRPMLDLKTASTVYSPR